MATSLKTYRMPTDVLALVEFLCKGEMLSQAAVLSKAVHYYFDHHYSDTECVTGVYKDNSLFFNI